MSRPPVVIALPPDELAPVRLELDAAGFETFGVTTYDDLAAVLAAHRGVGVAILDGEDDFERTRLLYTLLHDTGREIPALIVASGRELEHFASIAGTSVDDEFVTRPYSAESIRWRVEAMLIRSQTVDDGSGAVLQAGHVDAGEWARRARVIAVFNPKGGVGKTTIATNLAAALQAHKGQRVLLVDADTVTGHVTTSLGLEQVRTVVDAWRDEADGAPPESLVELAAPHPSGMLVVALTSSPLHTDILEPSRVAEAIAKCRRGFDFIIVDMHPSYGPLNLELFDRTDRILVPVTPDLPALRAAVQLRDVAAELGILDRIEMIINRANSGVSVEDMERTVGMTALALIRSGGLLFVRAANEGRTVIERFPREKVTEDFDTLAGRLLPPVRAAQPKPVVRGLFSRQKVAARA
ncbi:MAG TPA: AAA family ATPase [Candidatus Limnocylindrales bacterium]